MAVQGGCTHFTTLAVLMQFGSGVWICLLTIIADFLSPFPFRPIAILFAEFTMCVLLASFMYYLPSILGPNCCKVVKIIYTICQKYKNTASFLFSCLYLLLSVHPIVVEKASPQWPHAAVLCGISGAVISWVKLAASSRIASSIFACWFLPSSILAPIYLPSTDDRGWYYCPALAAIFSLIVPVDYKVLLRLRLTFNKQRPSNIPLKRCCNDIEMPLDRVERFADNDKKIDLKCPHVDH